ncbi:MAG: M24 family metallopeptidase [Thermoplasmata archaeon]
MDPNDIRLRLLQRKLKDDVAVIDSEAPELLKFLGTKSLSYLLVTGTEIKIIAHKVFEEELENLRLDHDIIITKDPELELKKHIKGRIYATKHIFKEAFDIKDIFSDILKKPMEEDLEVFKELTRKIDMALSKAVESIRIGLREYEVKAEIDFNLEKLGIDHYLYPTVVLFGKRTAYPMGLASEKKLEENEIILIDTAPVYRGYSGSIGRMIFTEFDSFWAEKLNFLNEVLQSAATMLFPGSEMQNVDDFIRSKLKMKGFEYEHYTGHSLGGFYKPMIYPGTPDILERNMIFTLEPGIYIHNRGGIRVKNHILVRDAGIEILDRFGKE